MLSTPELSSFESIAGAEVTCRVTVRNDGLRTASTVLQLYLRRVTATTWPRVRELRGFRRVSVPAGETVTVELPVGFAQLSTVDEDNRLRLEAGVVEVETGTSAADLRAARLRVMP